MVAIAPEALLSSPTGQQERIHPGKARRDGQGIMKDFPYIRRPDVVSDVHDGGHAMSP